MKFLMPVLCLLAVSSGRADTVLDFSFSGTQSTQGYTATGTGEITFTSGLTNVGLGDVTSFTFDLTICQCRASIGAPNPPYYTTESFSTLSDIALTLDPSGVPAVASLLTYDGTSGDHFDIQTTGGHFFGDNSFALFGPVTFNVDPAPEPPAVGLFAAGFAGVLIWRRRAATGRTVR